MRQPGAIGAVAAALAAGPVFAAAEGAGDAACAAPPLGGRALYLRGSFNGWAADEDFRFVWRCDRHELVANLRGEQRFKIGDEAWSADADFGRGDGDALAARGPEFERRFDGPVRLRLRPGAGAPTLQVDACPPPPLGDQRLFVRGSMNGRRVDEAYALRYRCDAYELPVDLRGRHTFTITDGETPPAVVLSDDGRAFVREFDGPRTLRLTVDAAGRARVELATAPPADAGVVTDPVVRSLRFDSRAAAHKRPFGAVTAGTRIDYAVGAAPGIERLTMVVERRRLEGNQELLEYTELARLPMRAEAGDGGGVRWRASHRFDAIGVYGIWFEAEAGGRRYALQNNRDRVHWTREKGSGGVAVVEPLGADLRGVRRFRQTVYAPDFRVPDWAADAVYYYVFPERFRNGDAGNDPVPGRDRYHRGTVELHADWNERPWRPGRGDGSDGLHNNDFFGGDLAGLIDRLDTIADLGANALYLTPIFRAASNHKYDTADYRRIDPAFGSEADFSRLTREAARRGLRVVIDTSFNHTGADSIYFDRYANHRSGGAFEGERVRTDSPYAGWYRFEPSAPDPERRYRGWVGVADLPELDKSSDAFRRFAFGEPDGITQHWLARGASGWRMDVAPWVPDDFWREWRIAVKRARPDAITIAETWFDASKHLLGDMFDSTMNYIFRNAVLDYASGGDARRMVAQLEMLREHYPPRAFHALMNLLSSHDQPRSLHVLGGPVGADADAMQRAKQRFRLALLLQMTYPGAPAVYYGDEVGVTGGEDPDNRATYPWPDLGGRPDEVLRAEVRRLIALRRAHPVLARGSLGAPLHADEHIVVWPRQLERDFALVATSNADAVRSVRLAPPAGAPKRYVDLLSGEAVEASDGMLVFDVPAFGGRVWRAQ